MRKIVTITALLFALFGNVFAQQYTMSWDARQSVYDSVDFLDGVVVVCPDNLKEYAAERNQAIICVDVSDNIYREAKYTRSFATFGFKAWFLFEPWTKDGNGFYTSYVSPDKVEFVTILYHPEGGIVLYVAEPSGLEAAQ